ncbi:MAG: DUF134 domain-containing protein [Candidatus Bathyarchaeia archaeon]
MVKTLQTWQYRETAKAGGNDNNKPSGKFEPTPKRNVEPILLEPAEIEALKLVALEKLTFEEAASRMKISRNTVWRLAEKAREKLIRAIVESREILIQHE